LVLPKWSDEEKVQPIASGIRCPDISWNRRRGRLYHTTFSGWKTIIATRNREIFSSYLERRRKLYPYFRRVVVRPSTAEDGLENNESVRLRLGRGTLWDCRGNGEPRLLQAMPGCRVKVFRTGVGIGPPTSF